VRNDDEEIRVKCKGPADLGTVSWTSLAILVLTVVAFAIPFLNQPFHMDDNFYMDVARNAHEKPLFPLDIPYTFIGDFAQDLGSHGHPPLQSYFLATILYFFGEGPGKEWIYHLFALVYPILAVLSFYFIAARFNERPLWPSMILACCPLFMVMQHTLMTDIPMLAFWLGAIASYLWAVHLKRTGLYTVSAFFQLAAMFTSYQAFALAPLLGFYQIRKGYTKKAWISLIIPPALVIAWFVLNCLHYKRMLFGVTYNYIQSHAPLALHVLWVKLASILEYQGWLIIFPLFIFYMLARNLKGRALVLALLAAACLAQFGEVQKYRLIDKTIFAAGLAAGLFIVWEMGKVIWSTIPRRQSLLGFEAIDGQFIGLWYFGVLFYCLFVFPGGSARYILPLIPPFLICFFRILEITEVSEYRRPARVLNVAMVASGSLVISLIWGLFLSRADQEFARIYPRFAGEFSRIVGKAKSYSVGEWGFRYYLALQGVYPLPKDESLVRGGSFIAIPQMALPHTIPASLNSMLIPVRTLTYKPDFSLRIFDWQTPAGFYSTGWGLIPFSFSWKNLEEVQIYQVNFMVEKLPWTRVKTISRTKPWPSIFTIEGKQISGIAAKSGTEISYALDVNNELRLRLLCGVSSDSHVEGSDASYSFNMQQLDAGGKVLTESHLVLQPGMKVKDRDWQPVRMVLKQASAGTLVFQYSCTAKESPSTGAFVYAVLEPVH
jgi:4-amino-4-deoxy-L-arabinose transferase-like glycosyltransferase